MGWGYGVEILYSTLLNINHFADLGFVANVDFLSNNSVVISVDFFSPILHCITNLTTCCTEGDGGVAGEWFLPGQTQAVSSRALSSTSFNTQGVPSAVALRNFRRIEWPSGIYTCQIPDTSGQIRTSYLGIDTGIYYHVTFMWYI